MEGKTALLTGAAGGIGAETARVLGEQGATIAAVDADATGLRETVDKMTADGLTVTAFPGDVAEPDEVESIVDSVEGQLGPIEYLVNAAGVLRMGTVKDYRAEDWLTTFAVNTNGVFFVSRAVVNRMLPRERGAVVTVASNAAGTPRSGMAAYAASKAAATLFTKSLGLEVARHGIRCNVVAPGSTDTPMLRSMWHDDTGPQRTLEGSQEAFRVGIPLGRIATPRDIAEGVAFLLSDRAAQITLHDLTVDGGASLGV
jgi:2,3-dihydro-2,3-dihydroxybenzoate dehydrogenase